MQATNKHKGIATPNHYKGRLHINDITDRPKCQEYFGGKTNGYGKGN